MRNLDVNGPQPDNGIDRAAALDLIALLLERGADPNARTREYPPERRFITPLGSLSWVDFTGQTPFLLASLSGDVSAMPAICRVSRTPDVMVRWWRRRFTKAASPPKTSRGGTARIR